MKRTRWGGGGTPPGAPLRSHARAERERGSICGGSLNPDDGGADADDK